MFKYMALITMLMIVSMIFATQVQSLIDIPTVDKVSTIGTINNTNIDKTVPFRLKNESNSRNVLWSYDFSEIWTGSNVIWPPPGGWFIHSTSESVQNWLPFADNPANPVNLFTGSYSRNFSASPQAATNVNNFLITPAIDFGTGKRYELSFWIGVHPQVPAENMAVYLIDPNANLSTATWPTRTAEPTSAHTQFASTIRILPTFTVAAAEPSGMIVSITLPVINGLHKLCFRHYNTGNQGYLLMDDIFITELQEGALEYIGNFAPDFGVVNSPMNFSFTMYNGTFDSMNNFDVDLKNASTHAVLETVRVNTAFASLTTRTFPITWTPTDAVVNEVYIEINFEVAGAIRSPNMSFTLFEAPFEMQGSVTTGTISAVTTHPFNFNTNTSITQTIYPASEMGVRGVITHIRYQYNGANAPTAVNVEIYLAQTSTSNFGTGSITPGTASTWIRPDTFTRVFVGELNLPVTASTVGEVWIELQNPFFYDPASTNGSNLVVTAYRKFSVSTFAGNTWNVRTTSTGITRTNRTLISASISDNLNMGNYFNNAPSARNAEVPIMGFIIYRTDAITLSGVITVDDSRNTPTPIEGVRVTCNLTGLSTFSNNAGEYTLPYFIEENWGIKTQHTWYRPYSTDHIEKPNRSGWIYDIELTPYAAVTVRGTVEAGHDGTPIAGAVVRFIHEDGTIFDDVSVLSASQTVRNDEKAVFELIVPEDNTFNVIVTANNYADYAGLAVVPDAKSLIRGTREIVYEHQIQMYEIFMAPIGAVSVVPREIEIPATSRRRNTTTKTVYDLAWHSPYATIKDATQMRSVPDAAWTWTNVNYLSVAHRYTRACRITYGIDDFTLYRIAFVPMNNPANVIYSISITRENTNSTSNQGTTIFTQTVQSQFLTQGQWSVVDLEQHVPLTGTDTYWIIIHVDGRYGELPQTFEDSGPVNNGLGNLINLTSVDGTYNPTNWQPMTAINSGYIENFTILIYTIDDPSRTTNSNVPIVSDNISIAPIITSQIDKTLSANAGRMTKESIESVTPLRVPRTYDRTNSRSLYRGIVGYNVYRIEDIAANYIVNPPSITESRINYEPITDLKWTDMAETSPSVPFRYAVVADWNDYFDDAPFSGPSDPIFSMALVATQTVDVNVYVTDFFGVEIEGAEVALVRIAGLFDTSIITDEFGVVEFAGIPVGTYRISVVADGYLSFSGIYSIYDNKVIQVSITLGNANRILLLNSFENPEGFPDNNWLALDFDGDDYNWENFSLTGEADSYHGNYAIYSQSFCTDFEGGLCLYPDNWLITPPIDIRNNMSPIISFASRSATRTGRPNREFVTIYAITDTDFVNIGQSSSPLDTHNKQVEYLKTLLVDSTNDPIGRYWPYGDVREEVGVKLFEGFIMNDTWEVRIIDAINSPNLALLGGERVRLALRHWQSLNNHYLGIDLFRVDWIEYPRVRLTGVVYDEEALTVALAEALRLGENAPNVKDYAIADANVTIKTVGMATNITDTITTNAQGVFTTTMGMNFRPGYEYSIEITASGYKKLFQEHSGNYIPFDGVLNDGVPFYMVVFVSDEDVVEPVIVTELVGNFPNPFNPITTISFNLASEGNVKIEIFNVKGQHVTTLVNDVRSAGRHMALWTGIDANNRSVGSGVYFYQMTTEGYTATQKMLLIK
jgi:hypothetical protein